MVRYDAARPSPRWVLREERVLPDATDHQLKRLDHLQAVVQRLAGNSFLIKGWALTLVSAILGFAVKDSTSAGLAWLALLPALVFWGLDGYHLALEQRFRKIYNEGADALAERGYPQCPKGLLKPSIMPGRICFCAWFGAFWRLAIWPVYIALIISALLVALRVFGPSQQELFGI
jgi:hypothetical protein